jgi:hypothetical protein
VRRIGVTYLLFLSAFVSEAQVYSPKVLRAGQPDPTDLGKLAQGIYERAGATTPRERAEAIWRFFLTDGRFVKPGFWYHIAGWAYEEPAGEVLDPVKLLNSYGFGLCYQIAPVLEAVWKAGGFQDARVWFLTGHTVAEVYYDGSYHYFDSDMMGYNPIGRGSVKQLPVASVHQIEQDGKILLSKLKSPKEVDDTAVDAPWYPADVREAAIDGLAELFTTTGDNWLFPFERAPQAHRIEFRLRPGERLIRYYKPERSDAFYLPYKFNGKTWDEFPQDVASYQIRTGDGPHSQKDDRLWATGRIEYRPEIALAPTSIYEVDSPYIIIDAEIQCDLALTSEQSVVVETSTDGGRSWLRAGRLQGPHRGAYKFQPAVLTRSEHGRLTAVTGSYGYLVKLTTTDPASVHNLLLSTRIQLNPRTLPELMPGHNDLLYSSGPSRLRRTLTVPPAFARDIAYQSSNGTFVSAGGQGFWKPTADGPADFIFRLSGENGRPLSGVETGGRFLDLSAGIAPDKFTAEIRKVDPLKAQRPMASIAWSRSASGPFQTIWEYDRRLAWKDGVPIDRTLLWPEIDRHVDLSGAGDVYIRYRIQDMAIDSFRLATETDAAKPSSPLTITHTWKENGISKTLSKNIPAGTTADHYSIDIPAGVSVSPEAVIFDCPR